MKIILLVCTIQAFEKCDEITQPFLNLEVPQNEFHMNSEKLKQQKSFDNQQLCNKIYHAHTIIIRLETTLFYKP